MKFVLGMFFMLLIANICNYVRLEHTSLWKVGYNIQYNVIEGNYLLFPATDRCSLEFIEYKVTKAHFHGCDEIQIKINKLFYGTEGE